MIDRIIDNPTFQVAAALFGWLVWGWAMFHALTATPIR